MNMDKTLDLVNKWRMKHGEQIEGLSEFLITEVFQNFENVKKDNMTLLVVDLHKLFILLKDKLRKNSFEEKKITEKVNVMSMSGYLPYDKAKKIYSLNK